MHNAMRFAHESDRKRTCKQRQNIRDVTRRAVGARVGALLNTVQAGTRRSYANQSLTSGAEERSKRKRNSPKFS